MADKNSLELICDKWSSADIDPLWVSNYYGWMAWSCYELLKKKLWIQTLKLNLFSEKCTFPVGIEPTSSH